MEILVCYDVATDTAAGRRRLRRVAQVCLDYGQRVQKSVFECAIDDSHYARLEDRLVRTIDPDVDSIRIYRLREPRERFVSSYGRDSWQDFDAPLVL